MNIEEAKKKLLEPQKIPLIEIIRKFKREGIENFVITRPEIVETLLTAYEKEKEENMSYYYHIQGLEDDIRMHYISTYKIKKEIKKIKDSNTYGYVGEEWNDRDVVELLENLISKEE